MIDMTDTPPAPIGAQIIARIVQALIPPHPDGHPLEECFPNVGALDASGNGIVPIPSGITVTPGMTYDGKAFGPPTPAPVVPPRPREATGYALISALSDDAAKSLKARDLSRLSARGQDGIPEQSDFVIRVAGKAGTTPSAWFDVAIAPAKA